MAKRLSIVIAILLVIFGGTFLFDGVRSFFIKRYFASFKMPPVTVSATQAKAMKWTPTLEAVGSLVAIHGVDVNSRVDGQVIAINFKSGQLVKKGQSLVQLDDSLDKQNLRNDEAQLQLTKLTFDRNKRLYQQKAVSESDLDTAQSNYTKAEAMVQKDKLNIAYKNIKAPFDGKLGIRQVNVGEYVTAGKGLVTLQSLNPLFVDFTLPQQDLNKIAVGQEILVKSDSVPSSVFKGKILAISSQVTADTRNVLIRGQIQNDKLRLLPGQFVTVKVLMPKHREVVAVPQTAVAYSLYGDSVYVIKPTGKKRDGKPVYLADQRFVVLGSRQGDLIAITKGVKAGEMVITSGQIKLHKNSEVVISDAVSFKD